MRVLLDVGMAELETDRREADLAAIRQAKVLDAIQRGEAHRALGDPLFGDFADRHGLSPSRAWKLAGLGEAIRLKPDLEAAILDGSMPLERAILAAPAIGPSAVPVAAWIPRVASKTWKELPAWIARLTRRRQEDGQTLVRETMALTAEGRAMLLDAVSGRARLRRREMEERGETGRVRMPRHAVLSESVEVALERVLAGHPIGGRRYARIDHAPGDFARILGKIGPETIVIRLESPDWDVDRKAAPVDVPGTLADLRTRHPQAGPDLLDLVESALGTGLTEDEKRPVGEALVEELKTAIRGEDRAIYRICRVLAILEELGFRGWAALGRDLLFRSPSTVSEYLSCGRACARFPVLDDAFARGEIGYSKIRTLAPHMDEQNFDSLLDAMRRCSVRELEGLRGGLRRAHRTEHDDRRRIRIEMTEEAWGLFARLERELAIRTGRPWTRVEVIEEVLWQALEEWGSPSPLLSPYRIQVHHDPDAGVHWMMGSSEIVTLRPHELDRVRTGDCVRMDVDEEFRRFARQEADRVARWPGPGECPNARRPIAGEDGLLRLEAGPLLPRERRAPPAGEGLRRAVYLRHAGRCAAAGCSCAIHVQVHHAIPRERGGGNDPANLILFCSRCHHLIHSRFGRLQPRRCRSVTFVIPRTSLQGTGP